MSKKTGIVIVILGAVLIILASLLFFHNQAEDERAGQEAESRLEDVQSAIEENNRQNSSNEESKELSPEMPITVINGYDYIGYLSIPVLEVNLPVMGDWDYDRLKIAPCRHFGSSRTDDLVIAAHNYKNHFGRLFTLQSGNTVTFTDMDGIVNEYVVDKIERVDPEEVERVKDSGYPLVMYTCNYDWSKRVAVFCNKAENQK